MFPDLVVFREPAGLQLGIDFLSVDANFETAAIGGDKHKPFDPGFQFSNEFFGQTDRFGFVVSNLAVDDLDFHSFNPQPSIL